MVPKLREMCPHIQDKGITQTRDPLVYPCTYCTSMCECRWEVGKLVINARFASGGKNTYNRSTWFDSAEIALRPFLPPSFSVNEESSRPSVRWSRVGRSMSSPTLEQLPEELTG